MTDRDHIAAAPRNALQRTGRSVLRWGITIGYSLVLGLVITVPWPVPHLLAVILKMGTIVVGCKLLFEGLSLIGLCSERRLVPILTQMAQIVGNGAAVFWCQNAGLREGVWLYDLDRGCCQLETLTPEGVTVTTAEGETITIGDAADLLYDYRYRYIVPLEDQQSEAGQ